MTEEAKTQEAVPANEATTAPAEGAQTAPDLTITDLTALKQIIDVASSRGAFKPNEMVTVGQTYSKLEAFLSAVNAAQQKVEPPKGE
jgi:hypothetical protein|tara:strand:- start:107 stop:367 length:261 start_codon:yes stop_codon:yes gene_type:complete